jgi:uncharacterized protein (TIGR02266 family)
MRSPLTVEQVNIFRFKVRLAISFGADRTELSTSFSYNMGTLGVFIETPAILPVGTPLVLEFSLPDSDRFISCNARVAWTNEPDALKKPSFPPGMGVQFIDPTPEDLHAMTEFLKECDLDSPW